MADRSRVVTRSQKRQAAWADIALFSRLNALGTAASLGSAFTAVGITERLTVARIRGTVSAHLDVGAALDAYTLGCGIIIVKDEAVAAGIASMPGPLLGLEQSWIWHHIFSLGPAATGTTDGAQILLNQTIELDTKAMRKMQDGDTLAFVWEGSQDNGTPTCDGLMNARFMVLLH